MSDNKKRKKTFHYTKQEIISEVKGFKSGGARVSVPSDWIGKQVKITYLGKKKKEK